ncbi:MAG: ribose-phosphate pyrophosphokinase [Candidatus Schekmanbacteria bacterium]|nr:ribose-phosphate pyrophosphokinase [Candidatus Schekmanbacteria bacterium]
MLDGVKLITGNSNRALAQGISSQLDIPLVNADVRKFKDGEIFVQINENVRGAHVFVIQSTCPPTNDNLMELLVIIDALKRASAAEIAAVIPYFGYARQDRKAQPRVPITAKLVSDLLTTAGADRVITVDLHAGQIQGFFDIPVDNLFATPVLIKYLLSKNMGDVVVVSPDAGGVERARAFAKRLNNATLAIIDKRRSAPNVAQAMHIIGEVKGRNAILIDDMIDTAGTMAESANALMKEGATSVLACCTHAVFSDPALDRIAASAFNEVIVTDTIPPKHQGHAAASKITVLSVAELLGEAINCICSNSSVSSLFA